MPNCTTVDRWKFPANKDCPQCKAAGESNTRGREGRGRHGRQIRFQDRQCSSDPSLPISVSPNLSISPWAASERPRSQEKRWDTPTRQKADAAWLVEHERRMSEIEEAASSMSIRSYRDRSDSRRSSPRSSYEQIIEADEVEEPEEEPFPRSKPQAIKMLPYETHDSDHLRSQRRSRKTSHDDERYTSRGQELVLSTPRRKTTYDTAMIEYPQEPSPQQYLRRARRTKTEPVPQSCFFDPPVAIMPGYSPIDDRWVDRYEMVSSPLRHDHHYPQYPVVY